MSARAIVSGSLHGETERRTSKTGKAYALATLKDADGDRVHWWSCFAFDEPVVDELMRLRHGDPVAVAGGIDVKIWEPPGRGARMSLRITVDAVLSLSKDDARKTSTSAQPLSARGRDRDDAA